jgi:phage protein
MDKKELFEKIESLPSNTSITTFRPYVDKKIVLGLISQLDEPEKVVIPKFVAEWIEYCKIKKISLAHALYRSDESENKSVYRWIVECLENQETFARAWLDGYEVEKEKRYFVKIRATKHCFTKDGNGRIFFSLAYKSCFTQTELEKANFGWVFDCEGIEIEEVEDE